MEIGLGDYAIGGFAAMMAIMVLFPIHCFVVSGALLIFGMLLARKVG